MWLLELETLKGEFGVGKWIVFLIPEASPRPCTWHAECSALALASSDVLVVPEKGSVLVTLSVCVVRALEHGTLFSL